MMENSIEKPALLIIDMIETNFDESRRLPITSAARDSIKPINHLARFFRHKNFPVVFSTDAFTDQDFFFTGKMKAHSLAGTPGAAIFSELDYLPDVDHWQQKPSMSAFFKTGLEDWLRRRSVTMCAVAGIATPFCVLTTVMDAVCHDFKAVLLEDCTASGSAEIQSKVISIYRKNPLYPLLRVLSSDQVESEFS